MRLRMPKLNPNMVQYGSASIVVTIDSFGTLDTGSHQLDVGHVQLVFRDEYFDTAVPQRHQTERGTWVFMPNGHNAGSPTDSMARRPSQKQRRRRRRRHAGPPPDDDPSEAPEGGEEEVRTSDPSVDGRQQVQLFDALMRQQLDNSLHSLRILWKP